ncbi:hypothetical protein SAMN02745746_04078 [Pseudogulbenkiania subflava DSM 22618]|uniref:Uncharacterized protein n=2 Tax=Pseudogulbenkiania subflava TaxID=451637 RepID=A0A1Y6CEE2_9NEIS|nr:hypothetical protein SAMN02745746_04078 [Pseudogulbenkiania subflava DSM 22618]
MDIQVTIQGSHDLAGQIYRQLREAIGLYGILAFYAGAPLQQGLLFGYGGIDAGSIAVALGRLAELLPRVAA